MVTKVFKILLTIWCSHMILADAATFTGSNQQYVKLSNDSDNRFELIILHNNDMHGRFDETDMYTNQCSEEDRRDNQCYGGFARMANIIRKYRAKAETGGPPVLYLNAGDTYTGTPWFYLYKENISTDFMNILAPDAMCLGNHEFDYGTDRLAPHLKQLNFPIVSANINYSKDPIMQNISNLKRSVVLSVRGVKVGIVGYTTPETSTLSLEDKVVFSDEIEAINREAQILHDEKMARIIIALGHSGIERDLEIAKHCPLVDIIVGGHSHTYIGEKQNIEIPYGPYPLLAQQQNGKKVPIIQAYAFTKYIGYIKLLFDENGNLVEWNGRPLLLDNKIEKEPDVVEMLEKYRKGVNALGETVIGQTMELLDGHSCRFKECNLGNMITDAMVYQYAQHYSHKDGWSDTSIGLIQSGGIRASIDGGTDITKLHINTVLPFSDRLVVEDLTGAEIKETLEWSVHRYQPMARNGEFLQMSGLRVIFNVSASPGNRVAYMEAICSSCFVPEFSPIELNKTYRVIMNEYLFRGGDGFSMLSNNPSGKYTGVGDMDNIVDYISRKQIIYVRPESRIVFDPELDDNCENINCSEVPAQGSADQTVSSWFGLSIICTIILFCY